MHAALLLFVMALSAPAPDIDPNSTEETYDLEFLKDSGVKPDVPGLLDFFRNRTIDEMKAKHIGELIERMGHPRFQVRDAATKELRAIGGPALRSLEAARRHPDSEIAERARILLDQIAAIPAASLAAAAARRLRNADTDDGVPVLLSYLPFADDRSVEDEVMETLRRFGQREGKPHPLLIRAVGDHDAARRAAAGFVLGRSQSTEQRSLVRPLLADPNRWVRLRTAQGLVAGGDKAAVRELIWLLDPVDDEVRQRSEELLLRIAGDKSPIVTADDTTGLRLVEREAWRAWWDRSEKHFDLAKLPEYPPVLGLMLGVEFNTNSVWESRRQGPRRWTIAAEGPMDVRPLPGNRMLIAEKKTRRVTERDLKGNILWQAGVDDQPVNCYRLGTGNTLIACQNGTVIEVRPDKSTGLQFRLPQGVYNGIRRMPNGHVVGITTAGIVQETDAAGKLIRTVHQPEPSNWGDVLALPRGGYIVTNSRMEVVREIDVDGKTLREVKVGPVFGLELLPNGQLLVSGDHFAKIVDWSGKCHWETKSAGYIRRIHLR